ncbi:hypothetical protein [Mycobacterium avium]|uniref:hypothetical protein n=1 Tax=Mycobacterium avium TaxID=1764 RepID=UPI000B4BAB9C|nr:hypothetical protein [Mycobacterium avium]QBC87368.1 hypothetical protein B6K05_023360 [Mycobacterium avium subsp. hominissuis]
MSAELHTAIRDTADALDSILPSLGRILRDAYTDAMIWVRRHYASLSGADHELAYYQTNPVTP